ncbi:6524_t:CDS:10 [Entrophospora sp. SA101]|nr:13115_t:CDS:10 [Entrophospora sp. SA101]CAJ0766278.1 6524_t:CDS:10 [Entrophospora sp. SA101]
MANNDDNFLSSPLSSGTAKLESLLFFLIERISREFRFPEPSLQEFCDEISNLQTPNDSIKLKEVLLKKQKNTSKICSKSNLFGIYIRKCRLESNKLSFGDIIKLFNALVKYKKTLKNQSSLLVNNLADDSHVLYNIAHKYHIENQELYAKCDAFSYLHYIITNLHKYGGVVPEEIERKIRMINEQMPELSAVHYIEFGHKEQAILAIKEAIEMARDCNDQECLRFALSWLYRLKATDQIPIDNVGPTEQQLLDSLILKAKKTNYIYSHVLGELGSAQRQVQLGSSPAEVFDSLFKSHVLNSNCQTKTMRYQEKLLNSNIWSGKNPNTEDLLTSICQLADQHASNGNYSEAIKLLSKRKGDFLRVRKLSILWNLCLEKVLYQKSFERQEIANIKALKTQIRAICHNDEHFHVDFEFNHAAYLAKIDRTNEFQDWFYKSNVVLELPVKNCQNSNSIEAENPIPALPCVLKSLCLSERFHYQRSFFLAILRLAQILIHFNLPNKAKTMIENIMHLILADHTLYLQSLGNFIYAQSMIACISQNMNANGEQSISWDEVLLPLEDAKIGFKHLESISELLKVLQLLSYIYNIKGDLISRDKVAEEFKNKSNQYNSFRIPKDCNHPLEPSSKISNESINLNQKVE